MALQREIGEPSGARVVCIPERIWTRSRSAGPVRLIYDPWDPVHMKS